MPNHYTAHKDEWKRLSDIDYFGMFVKAYIPFNAWMNTSYPALNTDREKVNAIKRDVNPFKSKMLSLIATGSQEGVSFRGHLGDLHGFLEGNYIFNQDSRITFTDIVFESNRNNLSEFTIRGIGFRVQHGNGTPNNTVTHSLIKNRAGAAIMNITQPIYDYEEFLQKQEVKDLPDDRRERILNCYREVAPLIKINLIQQNIIENPPNYIECGSFKLIDDSEKICRALIEILYKLRNSLFHGEIIPDKNANQIYGSAYQILRTLIEAI